MNTETIIVALSWGVISGYLILHLLDSLLGIGFCLHGLLMTRWKRLINKALPGQVKYNIVLRLLLRVTLYALLFGGLLDIGGRFVGKEFGFVHEGTGGLIWAITAALTGTVFLRGSWRRLVVVWKMSHVVDFAEKRQRTFLLKKK